MHSPNEKPIRPSHSVPTHRSQVTINDIDVPINNIDVPINNIDVPRNTIDVPRNTIHVPINNINVPTNNIDALIKKTLALHIDVRFPFSPSLP